MSEQDDKALARADRADAGIIEADHFKMLPEPGNCSRPIRLARNSFFRLDQKFNFPANQ
ncbi:hypothetical protein BN2476_470066 [Paraburkholderia piptadeniae]|uniref:Uncharacterized protein n=1 Tax=Paraburkholderia piptadeniae TaxID=1701573 RepID=A0A1N7SE29_9BURK|nr:hypothetical protein [Paraburkholderia piptadeniae]SIT45590.1 hypothetical protein BN2476_470066 [Paraburkholderia piptadeniae]